MIQNHEIFKKRYDLEVKSVQNSLASIREQIKELDTNYNLEIERLLIEKGFIELRFQELLENDYTTFYNLEEDNE